MTADGFIARSSQDRSFDWTSKEDKRFYIQTIRSADAIVISSQSFKIIKKFPKDLTFAVYTRSPETFINHRPDVITAFPTNDMPIKLIERLKKMGKEKIVIAGGSSIFTMFLKSGLVTKIYLTIEPIFFGQGVNLYNSVIDKKLNLVSIKQLSSQTLLLEYNL